MKIMELSTKEYEVLAKKGLVEEDKKIEKLILNYAPDIEEKIFYDKGDKPNHCIVGDAGTELIIKKINEIIDFLMENKQ